MNIYKDIAERTQGDIYIGVVGPVRTGKSTFIKNFMDTMVLPKIDNAFKKERATDELPQSAGGKTIMTTEPKFVPNEAVNIKLGDANCNVRLIDCVGYMVRGAIGAVEDDMPRMVQTPWNDEPIPFNEAAETGTRKVICEHSTIGLVVTTDGSITDIPRNDYEEAEQRVIGELKAINKPFILLLNSVSPNSEKTMKLRDEMEEKYGVPVMSVSCADMTEEDFCEVLEKVLYEFPLTEIGIDFPSWLEVLSNGDELKNKIYNGVIGSLKNVKKIREAIDAAEKIKEFDFADLVDIHGANLGEGSVRMCITPPPELFYNVISRETGFDIKGEEDLLSQLLVLKEVKKEYDKIAYALKEVDAKGYGIVAPTID